MNSDISGLTQRIAIAAVACLLAWPVLAESADARESPMLDYVDQKLLDIGAQLQNAKMRLTKDFAGVSPGDTGQPVPLVVECCRPNLVTIERKLKELRAAMGQMLSYYRDQRNQTAVGILSEMKVRLDALNTGMYYFARSPDKAMAFDARAGMIRPWNEFRNGIEALQRCCPIPPEVVPEPIAEDPAKSDGAQGDVGSALSEQGKKQQRESKEP